MIKSKLKLPLLGKKKNCIWSTCSFSPEGAEQSPQGVVQWTKLKAGEAARKLGENSDREAATWGNELPNLQTKHAPVLGGRPQEGQKKQQLETARLTIDFSCSSCKEYRRLELESFYFIYLLKKKFFTG